MATAHGDWRGGAGDAPKSPTGSDTGETETGKRSQTIASAQHACAHAPDDSGTAASELGREGRARADARAADEDGARLDGAAGANGGSTDHRGEPPAPACTVTVLPSSSACPAGGGDCPIVLDALVDCAATAFGLGIAEAAGGGAHLTFSTNVGTTSPHLVTIVAGRDPQIVPHVVEGSRIYVASDAAGQAHLFGSASAGVVYYRPDGAGFVPEDVSADTHPVYGLYGGVVAPDGTVRLLSNGPAGVSERAPDGTWTHRPLTDDRLAGQAYGIASDAAGRLYALYWTSTAAGDIVLHWREGASDARTVLTRTGLLVVPQGTSIANAAKPRAPFVVTSSGSGFQIAAPDATGAYAVTPVPETAPIVYTGCPTAAQGSCPSPTCTESGDGGFGTASLARIGTDIWLAYGRRHSEHDRTLSVVGGEGTPPYCDSRITARRGTFELRLAHVASSGETTHALAIALEGVVDAWPPEVATVGGRHERLHLAVLYNGEGIAGVDARATIRYLQLDASGLR